MPARLRRRVQALGAMTVPSGWEGAAAAPPVDPGVLTTTALACRDTERIRFSYTPANGQQADRHVEPHRLVQLGRRWYLVGYDLDRNDWRSYRLDRLAGPRATGARFRPRELPAADAAAFVRAGIDGVRSGYDIEVIIEAPAEVVSERIGHANVGFFLETYAHVLKNDDRDAAEQAASFLIGAGWDPDSDDKQG